MTGGESEIAACGVSDYCESRRIKVEFTCTSRSYPVDGIFDVFNYRWELCFGCEAVVDGNDCETGICIAA